MTQPDDFDAFYKETRTRLLLQTFALTGDLPASRAAVRDAFVVAWHHWRKVRSFPDPESWVRPHAWTRAQRRHTARIWYRDKSLDREAAATLEALGRLTFVQRKAFVLEQLTTLPLEDRARELGMTRQEAERQTLTASARFSVRRDVGEQRFPALFEGLAAAVEGGSWPRATILRRAGAARRRTHTAVGAVAGLAAVLVTGAAVQGADDSRVPAPETAERTPAAVEPPGPAFDASSLLNADQLTLSVDGRGWRVARTSDNTGGHGLVTPCHQLRYADPRGRAALVRTFRTSPERGEPRASAVQVAELSTNARRAHRTWQQSLAWYAGCTASQVQLRKTWRVRHVGDEAMLVHLRDWREQATYVAGVARTGRITTTTFLRTTDTTQPDVGDAAWLLGLAVNAMCRTPQGATCATGPETSAVAPVAVGEVPGLLVTADLPHVPGVRKPWVGTEPRQARQNVAATGCDRTDFSRRPVSNGVTRTFLIPEARLPATFGVTETAGTLPSASAARRFVGTIRKRMRSCPDRSLATDVRALSSSSRPEREHAVWRVTNEINDRQTVTFLMGVVRNGRHVGQLGFVPAGSADIGTAGFEALLRRSGERLAYLPR